MNSLNPENVPEVFDPRWMKGNQLKATAAQVRHLSSLLFVENIDAEDFFGEGFTTINELSSWSAHWAITALENMQDERQKQRIEQEYREREEEITKAYFAARFRAMKAAKDNA